MGWLTPMTAIIAGAITAPTLVLLYFLKLKRRELPVSCTLFWKRAVQDMQVNAPFQKLRRNILLLLQLLALLALVAGLGRPVLNWQSGSGKRYVIMIDCSASMGATDVEPTRLELAKQQAREFIETLRQGSGLGVFAGSDQAMVIAFAGRPRVICTFIDNRRDLLAAVDSVAQTDGLSNIAEAVRIARAFATPTDPESRGRSAIAAAKLVVFTDGRIADRDRVVLQDDEMVIRQVGRSSANIGITAFQSRRSYEDPDKVTVFAHLVNYGETPTGCDVQLSLDGQAIGLQHVELAAAKRKPGLDRADPGRAGVVFTLDAPQTGLLEVKQLAPDALAADDTAWTILRPAKRVSALLVTPGNLVLENALRSLPLAGVKVMTPDEFDAIDRDEFEVTRPFDVIILDRCPAKQLPPCGYLVFGPAPAIKGLTCEGPNEDQFILDWRTNHAVLKFVDLENVFAKAWWRLNLPGDAHVLAEAEDTAAIAMLSRGASSFLLVNFDVLKSNWPFSPGFVMFLYNATRTLGRQMGQMDDPSLTVGSSISVQADAGGDTLSIIRPDGATVKRRADADGRMRYANLDRVGLYRVDLAEGKSRTFAVNLLDENESDIGPPARIRFSGEPVAPHEPTTARANTDVRPLLVLIGLLVLSVEWFIYNKKVHI